MKNGFFECYSCYKNQPTQSSQGSLEAQDAKDNKEKRVNEEDQINIHEPVDSDIELSKSLIWLEDIGKNWDYTWFPKQFIASKPKHEDPEICDCKLTSQNENDKKEYFCLDDNLCTLFSSQQECPPQCNCAPKCGNRRIGLQQWKNGACSLWNKGKRCTYSGRRVKE